MKDSIPPIKNTVRNLAWPATLSRVRPRTNKNNILPKRWGILECMKRAVTRVQSLRWTRSIGVKPSSPISLGLLSVTKVMKNDKMIIQVDALTDLHTVQTIAIHI
ncbi:MAG: hypothetical protein QXL25_07555 [Candidatus Bathyarchaeia archaeon]